MSRGDRSARPEQLLKGVIESVEQSANSGQARGHIRALALLHAAMDELQSVYPATEQDEGELPSTD